MRLSCQRDAFNIPEDVAYLNTAYLGPMPIEAVKAGHEALEAKSQPWRIVADDFFAPVESLRQVLASLVGGDADGIAITPSASYGVAVAATNLPIAPGQTVVLRDGQFPSNVYGWRDIARRRSADVITARPAPNQDPTEALLTAIDERTAVVSVGPCLWSDGSRVDLSLVADRVRDVGASLVVDATQAVGAEPIDVGSIRPDFLIAAGYKFLLGPYGFGFLWAAPHRRDGQPIEQHWTARAGSEDFARLTHYRDDYRPGARRYDAGEVSSFVYIASALACARMIAAWGTSRVKEFTQRHSDRIGVEVKDMGCEPVRVEWRSPHLVGVRLPPGTESRSLVSQLAADRVHVSLRGESIRVSLHAFTTDEDVDRLLASLHAQLS